MVAWVRKLAALPMQLSDAEAWAGDDEEGREEGEEDRQVEGEEVGVGDVGKPLGSGFGEDADNAECEEAAEGRGEVEGAARQQRRLPPPPPPPPRPQGLLVEPFWGQGADGAGGGGGLGNVAAAAGKMAVVAWSQAWAGWARGGGRRALLGWRSEQQIAGAGAARNGGGGGAPGTAQLPLCIGCGEGRHAYHLGMHSFGRGHFGEVWRAVRKEPGGSPSAASGSSSDGGGSRGREGGGEEGFVLKRVLGARGPDIRLSGMREGYFGALFKERERALRAEVEASHARGARGGSGGASGGGGGISGGGGSGERREKAEDRGKGQGASAEASAEVLLEGHRHIVQFEESFEVAEDIWLVFRVSRGRKAFASDNAWIGSHLI